MKKLVFILGLFLAVQSFGQISAKKQWKSEKVKIAWIEVMVDLEYTKGNPGSDTTMLSYPVRDKEKLRELRRDYPESYNIANDTLYHNTRYFKRDILVSKTQVYKQKQYRSIRIKVDKPDYLKINDYLYISDSLDISNSVFWNHDKLKELQGIRDSIQ
ncbi:MAG: hypothetical protein KAS32_15175 [Candidatus Peribacteraceae bacterium]|nr:hypothetical protein [Candidatus Peribacteraceae bacterium]